MEIKKIPISEINPAPHNPRKDLQPDDPEYKQIEASIDGFGLVEPLVWNRRTKNLVGGHQRFKILVRKGCTEIEVSVVDLPLEKEKALNLALNKVQGSWDKEKLALLLDELTRVPYLDVGTTGFTPVEIGQLIDRYLETGGEDDFDTEGVAESIIEPVTQKGELIELGPHKILCEDCSVLENLERLISVEKVGLVHTDPPYNVAYVAGDRPNPNACTRKSCRWAQIHGDNIGELEYSDLLRKVFSHIVKFMDRGAAAYIWNGHKNFGPMHAQLEELGFHVASVIVWAKPNFAMSFGDYHEQAEFCLYAWLENNGSHRWFGSTSESTVWEVKRDANKNYIHPTQKPIALAQRAIINSSVKGDIVLDAFLGSGSTLIAAEGLGRRCYGLEIDSRYCDAIVHRYISYAGKDKVSTDIRKRYFKED
ncbi:MAG: site-specific DNA-methyltransferase [Sedimentisphaerales bacterium]|jgi:DNA modification methylase